MGHAVKKLGSVGGAGSSAKPGGYNQGPMIAAKGNYRGAVDGIQQMDLRQGNAAGSGPAASPSGGVYKQGDQFAASAGNERPEGQSGGGSLKVGSSDLRGGNAKSGTGYNQGAQFGANKK